MGRRGSNERVLPGTDSHDKRVHSHDKRVHSHDKQEFRLTLESPTWHEQSRWQNLWKPTWRHLLTHPSSSDVLQFQEDRILCDRRTVRANEGHSRSWLLWRKDMGDIGEPLVWNMIHGIFQKGVSTSEHTILYHAVCIHFPALSPVCYRVSSVSHSSHMLYYPGHQLFWKTIWNKMLSHHFIFLGATGNFIWFVIFFSSSLPFFLPLFLPSSLPFLLSFLLLGS